MAERDTASDAGTDHEKKATHKHGLFHAPRIFHRKASAPKVKETAKASPDHQRNSSAESLHEVKESPAPAEPPREERSFPEPAPQPTPPPIDDDIISPTPGAAAAATSAAAAADPAAVTAATTAAAPSDTKVPLKTAGSFTSPARERSNSRGPLASAAKMLTPSRSPQQEKPEPAKDAAAEASPPAAAAAAAPEKKQQEEGPQPTKLARPPLDSGTSYVSSQERSAGTDGAAAGNATKSGPGFVGKAVRLATSYMVPIFTDRRAGQLGKGAARSPLDAVAGLDIPGAKDLTNRADVALVGVQGEREAALTKVRQRGFVVRHAVDAPDGETMHLALALGPKLLAKLAVEEDLQHKKPDQYTLPERGRLAKLALKVLARSGLVYSDALLLHDPYALKAVAASMHPDAIACYFGSGIGLYFAWLRHYTCALAFPAVAGIVLYLSQLANGVDTPLVPAFCIFVALWTTLYLTSWRRREAATAFSWQVLDVEDEEERETLAAQVDKPQMSPAVRYLVTIPINTLIILFVIQAMLYCQYILDHASEIYGKDSLWVYWPTLAYCTIPPVCSALYGKLSLMLNAFEKHSTKRRAINNLIMKRFAFECVNSYCALFYIAFYLQDIKRLRNMLFSLMTVKQVMGNIVEVFTPKIMQKLKEYLAKRRAAQAEDAAVKLEEEAAAKERAADDAAIAAAEATAVAAVTTAAAAQVVTAAVTERIEAATTAANNTAASLGGSAPATAAAPATSPGESKSVSTINNSSSSTQGSSSTPPRSAFGGELSSLSAASKIASKPLSIAENTLQKETERVSTMAAPKAAETAKAAASRAVAVADDAAKAASSAAEAVAKLPTGMPGMQRVKSSLSRVTEEAFTAELQEAEVDIGDEYMEMVIQFGYCTLFAVVFPLAPLMALINNVVEYHIDLSKLLTGRRPTAFQAASIGNWALCLIMLGHAATITNCVIMALMSQNMDRYIPAAWDGLLSSVEGRILLAVIFEHVLLAVKAILVGVMDPKPMWVKARQAKIEMERAEQNKKYRLLAHNMQVAKKTVDQAEVDRAKAIEALQTITTTHDAWSFGPWLIGPLVALPYVVAASGLSMWTVLPAAVAIVGYMQHQKAKADVGVALGIVSDPHVLRLIGKELPSWFTDGEYERVEFINRMMHKMWRPTTLAVKQMILDTVQPLLNDYRPTGMTALGFRRISLGTMPPKIVAVRSLDVSATRATLDVEVKWASDMVIVLEAGVKPLPLVLELNKIRFSGKCRIELDPLVPVIPMFGAMSITFMEKPLLDFSFKVAKLDIMSIGAADLSIGKAVQGVIKRILADLLVFPKKLVIPIMDDVDLNAVANPVPAGILQVHIEKGEALRAADSNGLSDPYVEVSVGKDAQRTAIVPKDLNPVWDQDFDFLIHDPGQMVRFEVYDSDKGMMVSDDDLGECQVRIQSLQPGVPTPLKLVLQDTSTGTISVVLTFTPLTQAEMNDDDSQDQDVIFTLDGDALTDEIVNKSAFLSEAVGEHGAPSGPLDIGLGSVTTSRRPQAALPSDQVSVGVLTVSEMTLKEATSSGSCYLVLMQGATTRTTIVEKQATAMFPEVFHFLVRGAETASLRVSLMVKSSAFNPTKMLSKDKCRGVVQIQLGDVLSSDNELEDEFSFASESDDMHGSISLKLVYWPAVAAT